MPSPMPPAPDLLGLGVALGAGLLIGLERERRKGRGPEREAAGVRSFALVAFGGGLAQWLAQPMLVLAGALAVVALAALAYARGRRTGLHGRGNATRAGDPGMTTELALFVTYLLGVLAVTQPALGAGAAVVVALLLAARERLHRFATQALSQAELHDALLLAALLLVLLPLLPAAPVPWLGGISPRKLLGLVVLILALQGAGHVALRAAGARAGLPLSGLLSGFVSSTATVAAMGARARATPALWRAAAAGAVMSTAATWVQAAVMLAALAPSLLGRALPMVLVGASVALVCAAVLLRGVSAAATAQAPAAARGQAPLRWREALIVAALLAAAAGVVGLAERQLGESGAVLAAILPALLDAHASVAAVANLQALDRLEVDRAALAVWLAIAANGGTRSVVAGVAGGARYGAAVGAALLLSTALAGLALWISG